MHAIKFDRFIFAKSLCIAMEKANITSTALANFLMVDKHTILAYRKGDSVPNAEKLYYISRALKVSVDWMLRLDGLV
jgi:transcriptional regulator with XRE-family HTH domain